jgi:hypothetical protein
MSLFLSNRRFHVVLDSHLSPVVIVKLVICELEHSSVEHHDRLQQNLVGPREVRIDQLHLEHSFD